MRIPRFYEPQPLSVSDIVNLSPNVHRHSIQVLRLKQDSSIILFNGKGGEYHATLSLVTKRTSQATITQFVNIRREPSINTGLCLSIIKSDKMDFAIQKAVELGVTEIQPLVTERSVIRLKDKRLKKKHLHWQGIIIAACEQSGRTEIPILHLPTSLNEWLALQNKDPTHLCLSALPGHYPSIRPSTQNERFIHIIIGPEGGYTDTEIILLKRTTKGVSLGSLILRAETASTVALTHLTQSINS